MKIIGLCGGSGSGKGYVAAILESRGIPVIDCDRIYHALVSSPSECVSELEARFGAAAINENGSLNRRRLAEIVFGDADALRDLNAITHRHILAKVRTILDGFNAEGYCAAAVDAPVLYESGFDSECDFVIAVTAPVEVRVSRIMKRDGIDEQTAAARIKSQITDDVLMKKSKYSIENVKNCDPTPQIDRILSAEEI